MAGKWSWKKVREGYARFAEKEGFAVIITVCVAVITGTAVWTQQQDAPYVAPTSPVVQDISAAQLMQQSLADAVTPSPAPTKPAEAWAWPVSSRSVLQGYNDTQMVRSGTTGIWTIHDAIDLAADTGEPIRSVASGTVEGCGTDSIRGAWVLVAYPEDVTALYAGMAMLAAIAPGDAVYAGQTLGFGGNGMLAESDLPPHVHLRVTKEDAAIDPMALLGDKARKSP